MITMILASAALAGSVPAEVRQAYSACLRDAVVNAKVANIPPDGFKAYAHQACAAPEGKLKAALAAFNVKNGMGRKAANEDAQVQIDDYVYSAEDKYRFSLGPPRQSQAAIAPSK